MLCLPACLLPVVVVLHCSVPCLLAPVQHVRHYFSLGKICHPHQHCSRVHCPGSAVMFAQRMSHTHEHLTSSRLLLMPALHAVPASPCNWRTSGGAPVVLIPLISVILAHGHDTSQCCLSLDVPQPGCTTGCGRFQLRGLQLSSAGMHVLFGVLLLFECSFAVHCTLCNLLEFQAALVSTSPLCLLPPATTVDTCVRNVGQLQQAPYCMTGCT